MECNGLTLKGFRCKLNATVGNYCRIHSKDANKCVGKVCPPLKQCNPETGRCKIMTKGKKAPANHSSPPKAPVASFGNLPRELLERIAYFLPPESLRELKKVDRITNEVATRELRQRDEDYDFLAYTYMSAKFNSQDVAKYIGILKSIDPSKIIRKGFLHIIGMNYHNRHMQLRGVKLEIDRLLRLQLIKKIGHTDPDTFDTLELAFFFLHNNKIIELVKSAEKKDNVDFIYNHLLYYVFFQDKEPYDANKKYEL